jgi:hypothetical protein
MLRKFFSNGRQPSSTSELDSLSPTTSLSETVPLKEFENALDIAVNKIQTCLSTDTKSNVKASFASALANMLIEDEALELVVAFCGIPTYSRICAKSSLGMLLCKSLCILMDCVSMETVQTCTKLASRVLSGLIQTEEGQENIVQYVDILISLAVDDRAMVNDRNVCTCISNVARELFSDLAKFGFKSQPLHEDIGDKRFLPMLLHKAQAAMDVKSISHSASLAALALRLLRAQTIVFSGSEALLHFSHDGTYNIISRLLHALPNHETSQEFENAFLAILSLSMNGDVERVDDGYVRNYQAFVALHNSVLMSLNLSSSSDSSERSTTVLESESQFNVIQESEIHFRALALLMRVYCLHETNAQRLESRFQVMSILATTLRTTGSLELVTMIFKSIETIAIAMDFLPRDAFVQLFKEVAYANSLTFDRKMGKELQISSNITADILMEHLFRCVSNVLEFKPDYSDGLASCGLMEVVVIPLLQLKCSISEMVLVKRKKCLHLHLLGLSLLLMFMTHRTSAPLKENLTKRLFEFVRATLSTPIENMLNPNKDDISCRDKSENNIQHEHTLIFNRAKDALAIFIGASQYKLKGLQYQVERLIHHSIINKSQIDHINKLPQNIDLHTNMIFSTLNSMMKVNGRVRTMFRKANGFESCVRCIRDSGTFERSNKSQHDQWMQLVQTILKTMAQSMAGPLAPNREYVMNNIGYKCIADVIVRSGILLIEPQKVVNTMLGVFCGAVVDQTELDRHIEGLQIFDTRQLNANALRMIFEVLPHLNSETLSLETMKRVVKMVKKGGIRCYDTLASAGAVSWVLTGMQKYSAGLRHEACMLIKLIASHRMNPDDLRRMLKQTYETLDPRSQHHDMSVGEQLWYTIVNIVHADVQVQFTEFVRSPSHSNGVDNKIGGERKRSNSSGSIQHSNNSSRGVITGLGTLTWPPVHGITFGCWLRIPFTDRKNNSSNQWSMNIISLKNGQTNENILSITLSTKGIEVVSGTEVRIASIYNNNCQNSKANWHHLFVSHARTPKKKVRDGKVDGTVNICFDGLPLLSKPLSFFNCGAIHSTINVLDVSVVNMDIALDSPLKFHLGPILMSTTAEPISAALAMFIRGPQYPSAFQGVSSDINDPESLLSCLIHKITNSRCSDESLSAFSTNVSCLEILALLGLNTESYNSMCDSIGEICAFRFSNPETILFFFHPSYHIEVEETDSIYSTIVSRQAIPNVAAGSFGAVHNGVALHLKGKETLAVCPVSMSKSLRNIGGISTLLPLLDISTSNHIDDKYILDILRTISMLLKNVHGVQNSIELEKKGGYKILGYLLLRVGESGSFLEDTLKCMFDIATTTWHSFNSLNSSKNNLDNFYSPVIIDPECMRTVIMNHAIVVRSKGGAHYVHSRKFVIQKICELVDKQQNIHYEYNIMILCSLGMVSWLLNTMLDDAKHIGRTKSIVADEVLISTDEQHRSLCHTIKSTGNALKWIISSNSRANLFVDGGECSMILQFLLSSSIQDFQCNDLRHDGYTIMQITLFRVLMSLPTLVDKKSFSNVCKTYDKVFVQSNHFFSTFIEYGCPWQTSVECLRFLITLTQSNIAGACERFAEVHQSGVLDELSDVGAIYILLISMWLGIDVCTLDEELFEIDGRDPVNCDGIINREVKTSTEKPLTCQLLVDTLLFPLEEEDETIVLSENLDKNLCELALEKVVDLLENNMRRQYADTNATTKRRRNRINNEIVLFFVHLSSYIQFDSFVCHQLSRIAFAAASHSNASETNTTSGTGTFVLNIMDDYVPQAQLSEFKTPMEVLNAEVLNADFGQSEFKELGELDELSKRENTKLSTRSRSSTLSNDGLGLNTSIELYSVDALMFEEPPVSNGILSLFCDFICRDLLQTKSSLPSPISTPKKSSVTLNIQKLNKTIYGMTRGSTTSFGSVSSSDSTVNDSHNRPYDFSRKWPTKNSSPSHGTPKLSKTPRTSKVSKTIKISNKSQIIVNSIPSSLARSRSTSNYKASFDGKNVTQGISSSVPMVFDSFPSHAATDEVLSFSAALLRQIRKRIRSENKVSSGLKQIDASSDEELCHLCEFLSKRCYEGWFPCDSIEALMVVLEILQNLEARGQKRTNLKVPYESLNNARSSCHMLLVWMLSTYEKQERRIKLQHEDAKGKGRNINALTSAYVSNDNKVDTSDSRSYDSINNITPASPSYSSDPKVGTRGILKVLRIIEVHDTLLFRSAKWSSSSSKKKRNNKAVLSSPMISRSRSGMLSSSVDDSSPGARNHKLCITPKEFFHSFVFLTFPYLVSDDRHLRSTTLQLWKSLLIHDETIFNETITLSTSLRTRLFGESPRATSSSLPSPSNSRGKTKRQGSKWCIEGFSLLKTDMNRFSLWLVNELENVRTTVEAKAGKTFKKIVKMVPSTALSSKSGKTEVPVARSIELQQLQWKQSRALSKKYRATSTSSSATTSNHSNRSVSQAKSSHILTSQQLIANAKNEIIVSHRDFQRSLMELCEQGRVKWLKLYRSMVHERSPLYRGNITRWMLDERQGPLRMRTRLKRHHDFYEEYGFTDVITSDSHVSDNETKLSTNESANINEEERNKTVKIKTRRLSIDDLIFDTADQKNDVQMSDNIDNHEDNAFSPVSPSSASSPSSPSSEVTNTGRHLTRRRFSIRLSSLEEDALSAASLDTPVKSINRASDIDFFDTLPSTPPGSAKKQKETEVNVQSETDDENIYDGPQQQKWMSWDPEALLGSFIEPEDGPVILKLNTILSHGTMENVEGLFVLCEHALHFVGHFSIDVNNNDSISEIARTTTQWKYRIALKDSSNGKVRSLAVPRTKLNVSSTLGRSSIEEKLEAQEIENEKRRKTWPNWHSSIWHQTTDHEHHRISLSNIREFHKRRYLLRHVAIEIFDVNGGSMFVVLPTPEERDELYNYLWRMPMPSCILHTKKRSRSVGGINHGPSSESPIKMNVTISIIPSRHRMDTTPQQSSNSVLDDSTTLSIPVVFRSFRERLTRSWLDGELSNFVYIMYLNTLAGRSTNDLAQYPVFPWVLSQYDSDHLDLSDASSFRDLSKPMGALGEERASYFMKRYKEALELNMEDIPLTLYMTHYSNSSFVINYLMRLEPFSRMHVGLQSGKFDGPDRLLKSVSESWKTASGTPPKGTQSYQDVRELIPEWYNGPAKFLNNENRFLLGTTQSGINVNHVETPPWARHSTAPHYEFIRLHRLALESEYVSRHLHLWIDLIFGFRQTGKEAEESLNIFHPVTYEGVVDIDSVENEKHKQVILEKIQQFGQTPGQLFTEPHPQKKTPNLLSSTDQNVIHHHHADNATNMYDSDMKRTMAYHAGLSGPLIVPGLYPPVVMLKSSFVCSSVQSMVGVVFGTKLSKTSSHLRKQQLQKNRYNKSKTSNVPVSYHGGSVMDMFVTAKRAVCVRSHLGGLLTPPTRRKYVSWGYPDGSVRFHVAIATARHPNIGKVISVHENLHTGAIRCAIATDDGGKLITGGNDCTVCVWSFVKTGHLRTLTRLGHLCGHDGPILSVTVCQEHGILVSGSDDGSAIIWDLQKLEFVRELSGHGSPVITVSCNKCTGDILTVTKGIDHIFDRNKSDAGNIKTNEKGKFNQELRIWSINGFLLVRMEIAPSCTPVTSALLPGKEWWQDGIAVVTGHKNGLVQLWQLEFPSDSHVRMGNGILRRSNGSKSNTKNATDKSNNHEHINGDKKVLIVVDGIKTFVTPPWKLSLLSELKLHQSAITALCITGTGHRAILGTGDERGVCARWTQDIVGLEYSADVNELFDV